MDPSQNTLWTSNLAPNENEVEEMKAVLYREAIGSLMYLCTRTRPDISVAVNILSRHTAHPRPIHWVALKRVLRHLEGTEEYGIHLAPTDSILSCHSDSDWAGSADKSSVSGHFNQHRRSPRQLENVEAKVYRLINCRSRIRNPV